jgi:hypothetical protein
MKGPTRNPEADPNGDMRRSGASHGGYSPYP